MDFNAAIFDLDGTILDSMDVWEHIDIQFLKKRNLPVPENYVTEICARSFEEAAQYTIDLLGLQETVEGIIEEWNNMAVEEYSNHVGLLPHALDYLLYWECTGGSVLSGETSLQGAIREVKEELGILLTPGSEKLIYQSRRENVQDFYDVWLFHKDIKIEEMRLQETEVVDVQWVNPDKLFEMFRLKHLHPLITYVDQLIG